MAGQGIRRREVLRILGTAAAAAQFPGFSRWAFACGHVGNAALQVKPAIYRPQFFTASEYAMVERLTDIIIPSDGTPGAKEAGVAEFIDFMVANDPEVQYSFRTGLSWLNAHAEQTDGKRFVELTSEQQTSLLEPLGFKDKARSAGDNWASFLPHGARVHGDGLLYQPDWIQGVGQSGAEILRRVTGMSSSRRSGACACCAS